MYNDIMVICLTLQHPHGPRQKEELTHQKDPR